MGDVERLIAKWKAEKPDSGQEFERGYDAFRAGVMLQVAREAAGLTQQQVAERMGTKKSAISRLENNAGDVRLSTLQRYAEAVGCRLVIDIAGLEEDAKPAVVRKPRKPRKLIAADTQS
ncbi:MAG TPA: helix-turn-helix transcriptional regulator [Longimicrobium sp.]|nr:helix-turn-helix transcriptional regulator [Longimicrobium sp.]